MNSLSYELRPNKYISRRLFIEALRKIDRWRPISEYVYVGFGSVSLEDHKLIHSEFDSQCMISVERDPLVYRRQKFNVPYDTIICVNVDAGDLTQDLYGWLRDRQSIEEPMLAIWLDYEAPRELGFQLDQLEEIVSQLDPGSLIRVTLNAHVASLDGKSDPANATDEEKRERRLDLLHSLVGDRLPASTDRDNFQASTYPSLLQSLARSAMTPPILRQQRRRFIPLLTEVYQDGQQMLCVTGMVIAEGDVDDVLAKTGFVDWEFYSSGWSNVVRIDVPSLTLREKLYLDQLSRQQIEGIADEFPFFLAGTADATAKWVSAYKRFSRFYPNFLHVRY